MGGEREVILMKTRGRFLYLARGDSKDLSGIDGGEKSAEIDSEGEAFFQHRGTLSTVASGESDTLEIAE